MSTSNFTQHEKKPDLEQSTLMEQATARHEMMTKTRPRHQQNLVSTRLASFGSQPGIADARSDTTAHLQFDVLNNRDHPSKL